MKTIAFCLLASLALSACTTGIKSSSTINNPDSDVTQFPVETAVINIFTKEYSDSLYSLLPDKKSLEFDYKIIPKAASNFENQQVQSVQSISSTSIDNEVITRNIRMSYFTLNPFLFKGYTSSSGEYSVATQSAILPRVANVGSSGKSVAAIVYSDSSKSNQIRSYTEKWSLSKASQNTAWFCIEELAHGNLAFKKKKIQCFEIDEHGDILDSKIIETYKTEGGVKTIEVISRL